MRKRLTERDIRRIEAWARKSNLHAMLSFLEEQPRKLELTRPMLLGSNGPEHIYVEGLASRWGVISEIANLDEPFNPRCLRSRTTVSVRREQNVRPQIYGTLAEELRKGFRRLCYHDWSGDCQGEIVRSHTIQESLLRRFAVDGHLLEFNALKNRDPEKRNWPVQIGVDQATTFHGFCARHDHAVFSRIEGDAFNGAAEGLFLYAYRALCADLYTIQVKFEKIAAPLEAMQQLKTGESLRGLETMLALTRVSVNEVLEIKREWDQWLKARDYTRLEHAVFRFPKSPDLFVTAFFAPRKDFRWQIIQETRTRRRLQWVAFSLVPANDGRGGILILSAPKGTPVYRQLVTSFLEYGEDKRTMALVNYILPYFERTVFAPRWWNALSGDQQQTVVNTRSAGYYPRHLRYLSDWGPITPVQTG